MTRLSWRTYLLVFAGMVLTSLSATAENPWVDFGFWIAGYLVLIRAVRSGSPQFVGMEPA